MAAKIDVTFFKLGKTLFRDSITGDIGNGNNDYKATWYPAWHTRPVHAISFANAHGGFGIRKWDACFTPSDLPTVVHRALEG